MPDAGSTLNTTLFTFGSLELYPEAVKRVTPQQLLLLVYIRLEGVQSRTALASLLWPHLRGETTRKGERKDLSNLSVAFATIRRHLDVDPDDHDSVQTLHCDASLFEAALAAGAWEQALGYFRRGPFLNKLENRSRLTLGADLEQWLTERRNAFTAAALRACLELDTPEALREAYDYSASVSDLHLLDRLYQRIHGDYPKCAEALRNRINDMVNDYLDVHLSEPSLDLYLALCLQPAPNLRAAQITANLSPKQAVASIEELLEARLATVTGEITDKDLAEAYLLQNPAKKMALLTELVKHTPDVQAYGLFREIFDISQTFGGAGYWQRARNAYCAHAQMLLDRGDYARAAATLQQFQSAEELTEERPHPDNRFLQAYCLERLNQYKEGVSVLEGVEDTPRIAAIRSALLFYTGDKRGAEEAALKVKALEGVGEQLLWARAIAANTLGLLAYREGKLHKSSLLFEQAATYWSLAGRKQRELGARMNLANTRSQLGRTQQAQETYEAILQQQGVPVELQCRILLNLGRLCDKAGNWEAALRYYLDAQQRLERLEVLNEPEQVGTELKAWIYNNLGFAQWKLGHQRAAETLRSGVDIALHSGDRLAHAKALGNLGIATGDIVKLETGLDLLLQLGYQEELSEYQDYYENLLRQSILAAKDHGELESLLYFMEKIRVLYESLHPKRAKRIATFMREHSGENLIAEVDAHLWRDSLGTD